MQAPKLVVLDSTAREINDAHRLARENADSAVQNAIRCGELLLRKKAELRHGEFKRWVAANCDFSYESAVHYMRAARQKSSALLFSSLREALGYADEKPAPPAQQSVIEMEPAKAQQQPTFESVLSIDLSSVGPPMTDEEREYVAKSPERIGRMITEFAERKAQDERIAAEIRERFPPCPDQTKAGKLGLDVLARVRELSNAIDRAGCAPALIPEHRTIVLDHLRRITAFCKE